MQFSGVEYIRGDKLIKGIGTDIIEIERMEKAIEKKNFVNKIFNESELKDEFGKFPKANSLAGKFSAKEAVSKAIGTGIRGFSLKDIEILKDSLGKPYVILRNNAEKIAAEFGEYRISISISHSRINAIAIAVLEVV
jgi:phosphopantethiene--protein transferase domain